MAVDFTDLTEVPGSPATREQHARLYHRYHTAARYVAGQRVLEVACGAGMGLGYLAQTARLVIGGDYTYNLLRVAHAHYQQRVPLLALDAQALPFSTGAFDTVVLFEALYYVPDAERFVAESVRVLTPTGTLIIGTVNKDWAEFAPSPHSYRYFSAAELKVLLMRQGFTQVEFFGAFLTTATSLRQRLTAWLRRAVVTLDLMPKTLEGRARFKRLFYGALTPLAPEVQANMAELYPLVLVDGHQLNTNYKILYEVAHRV